MFAKIQIIGCGVIGLTTAISLRREFGLPVEIIARELPPKTTSNVAAAVWLPFQVAPVDKTIRWAAVTREVLEAQMNDGASGVFQTELFDLYPEPHPDPQWVAAVPAFRYATADELPEGYQHGVVAEVPMIDTPVYMQWLLDQFSQLGGGIRQASVEQLTDFATLDALTVNCTGLGARSLCDDQSMFPIRGQIARLDRPDYTRALTTEHGPDAVAYLLPRRGELIAGGTTGHGDWNEQVDPATAAEILSKVQRLDPGLAGVNVLEHVVGLRPGRPAVRLELERLPGERIVLHNYGHGGAGFTLAWGCARDAVALVATLV